MHENVRTYRVRGICLVPSFAEISIEASSEEEAMEKANVLLNSNSKELRQAITENEDSAGYDFIASHAYPICPTLKRTTQ